MANSEYHHGSNIHGDKTGRVRAITTGGSMEAGDTGTIVANPWIDSEEYLVVLLDDGREIGPSLADYWEVEGQPDERPS